VVVEERERSLRVVLARFTDPSPTAFWMRSCLSSTRNSAMANESSRSPWRMKK